MTPHTLEELRSGDLDGIRHLALKEGLRALPEEILGLSGSLEILDLSGNALRELPDWFARLEKLRIAFFSANDFEILPEVLGRCPALEMVGFKSNRIAAVPENALPERLRWLILTDNSLPELPASLGRRPRLQKLMLAGNRLESLPDLARCENLELVRLAANRLPSLPDSLLELPRLAWLAYSGNPFCRARRAEAPVIEWRNLSLGARIGEGASGFVHRALLRAPGGEREVAVKIFKGCVTSDGLPSDEQDATLAAGSHPRLVPVLGRLDGHPDGKEGLVLELVPPDHRPLAQPPSFETCTRDAYPSGFRLAPSSARSVADGIGSLLAHLHSRGVCHGDLYAHNVLVDGKDGALLGDFGAAGFLDDLPPRQASRMVECEHRALAILREELAGLAA